MILRTVAIILLLLLAFRLLVRLAFHLTAGLRAGHRGHSANARDTVRRREVRQLAQCPVCGTYFEAGRGLPRKAGEAPVCSQACRTPAAAADAETSRYGGA